MIPEVSMPSSRKTSRRTILKSVSLTVPALFGCRSASAFAADSVQTTATRKAADRELKAELVIIGGGLGGCAAALAAARHNRRVILTEETDWIGGQLTQQAVPPDESPWIESFGSTRTYRELRSRIREYYRRNFPLTTGARSQPYLDPGNGSVSALCHEPRVALAVLYEMLAPYIAGGRITLLLNHKAVSADAQGDEVRAVTVRNLLSGSAITLTAPYFIDATELGDLLPMTRTEYVTGAESQKDTGEPHAPGASRPANMQAFTCCFAMDYLDGEDHVIEKPAEYDFWRNYVPKMMPPWPGKLLSLDTSHPHTLAQRTHEFDPKNATGLWTYRRIADKSNYLEGTYPGDISLINWPQNDYLLGNLIDVSEDEAARHLQRAKQLSLSLLYWLQTEAPRPDGSSGWKGLRLRPDVVGTEDGMAKYPYIRESRRIRAEFTVLEQHVGTEARAQATGKSKTDVTAEPFADSIGIGSYRIDLHPSTDGDNYIDVSSLPFQIPLGAMIPVRVRNLLPACKNIGTTHITNGCYRLHPVEWSIAESVGTLAAYCLSSKQAPHAVRNTKKLVQAFQAILRNDGVELSWPRVYAR